MNLKKIRFKKFLSEPKKTLEIYLIKNKSKHFKMDKKSMGKKIIQTFEKKEKRE